MRFDQLPQTEPGKTLCPFAGKTQAGDWLSGVVSVDWLQEHFGQYETAAEMKAATESEGLKRYFDWLAAQGLIPAE